MDFFKMSFPESDSNIKNVRKYAKSKELSLKKVKNKNLWNIIECQTGRVLLEAGSLEDAYDTVDKYEY